MLPACRLKLRRGRSRVASRHRDVVIQVGLHRELLEDPRHAAPRVRFEGVRASAVGGVHGRRQVVNTARVCRSVVGVVAHHRIHPAKGVAIADEQDRDRRCVGVWRTGKRHHRNRQHSGKETLHDTSDSLVRHRQKIRPGYGWKHDREGPWFAAEEKSDLIGRCLSGPVPMRTRRRCSGALTPAARGEGRTPALRRGRHRSAESPARRSAWPRRPRRGAGR